MIPLSPATRIFLAAGATDLRKGFEPWNIPPCHLYWARQAAEG